jgi:hypothetical protein
MGTASQLGEKVTDIKESAEALARAAGKTIDDVRTGTADALHTAASSIRSTGRQSAEAINEFSAGAADTLHAAGTYVKKVRLKNVPDSLRRTVRQYPAGSMVVAAALGCLAASAFRAMTHTCERE